MRDLAAVGIVGGESGCCRSCGLSVVPLPIRTMRAALEARCGLPCRCLWHRGRDRPRMSTEAIVGRSAEEVEAG